MTEEPIVLYRKRIKPTSDGHNLQVWTVFIDQAGTLRECTGYVRDSDLDGGSIGFLSSEALPGDRRTGNDEITTKRLFEGYSIHPQPYLLNGRTLQARPDPEASRLTGLEGETLMLDPALNPTARALGSPDWFF